jgi:hypothetical protein
LASFPIFLLAFIGGSVNLIDRDKDCLFRAHWGNTRS